MNMGIWVIGTSNQLSTESYKLVTGRAPFFDVGPLFYLS